MLQLRSLRIPLTPPGLLLVLDPATEQWEQTDRLGEAIVRTTGTVKALTFLGTREIWPIQHVQDYRRWASAQRTRCANRPRLVSPALEKAGDSARDLRPVVIAKQAPWDVADWIQTAELAKSVWIGTDEDTLPRECTRIDTANSELDDLAAVFFDPVRSVTVKGDGFFPLTWEARGSNAAPEILNERDQVLLRWQPEAVTVELLLCCLLEERAELQATVRRGEEITVAAVSDPRTWPQVEWQSLPKEWVAVMDQIFAGQRFSCPHHLYSHDALLKECLLDACHCRGAGIVVDGDRYLSLKSCRAGVLPGGDTVTREGVRYHYEKSGWKTVRKLPRDVVLSGELLFIFD